jgi:hypothetical protein
MGKVIQMPLFVEHQCSRCARVAMGEVDGVPQGWYLQNGYLLCDGDDCRWDYAG